MKVQTHYSWIHIPHGLQLQSPQHIVAHEKSFVMNMGKHVGSFGNSQSAFVVTESSLRKRGWMTKWKVVWALVCPWQCCQKQLHCCQCTPVLHTSFLLMNHTSCFGSSPLLSQITLDQDLKTKDQENFRFICFKNVNMEY